jgi:hypothetical protein
LLSNSGGKDYWDTLLWPLNSPRTFNYTPA